MPKLNKPIRVKDYVGNEERKQWIGSFPRITYLGRRVGARCDAMSGPSGPRRRRCKSRAQFKFVALKRSDATDGEYCWTHLADIFENDEKEKAAMNQWAEKHPPSWEPQYQQFLKDAGVEDDAEQV